VTALDPRVPCAPLETVAQVALAIPQPVKRPFVTVDIEGEVIQVIEIDPVRGRRAVLVGVGMSVASLLLLAMGATSTGGAVESWVELSAGAFGLFTFGPSIVLFIQRLVRNEPQLTIRTDGLVDNASRLKVAFIPWSEIETVSVAESRRHFVALTLRHPEEVLPRLGVWRRALLFLDRKIVKADVILPTAMLPYSSQELVDLLRGCAKQYRG
jgi:hypothetical protein